MKEQVEQLQNEVSKLQDDLTAARAREGVLKQCENEKQGCAEKNFLLRKEVNGLQVEINQLKQLLENTQVNYQASSEQVKLLTAEVIL